MLGILIRQEKDIHMSLESLVVWVIIGGMAGWLAGFVMKARFGLIGDIIIGIVGGIVGGFVLNALDVNAGVTGINFPSLITAFIGAVLFLGLVRAFRRY